MQDWREELLAGLPLRAAAGAGPAAVRWAPARLGAHDVVVVAWDFDVAGGSFGERDASSYVEATDWAVDAERPLVALVRSGGTRLQEGVAALVGMARATLARQRLAEAGLPLLAVADHPTTGGVFVTVVSRADLRCAVTGATVGFAGPRVVEAVTGLAPDGSHTADAAAAAGLVDAVLAGPAVRGWLEAALDGLRGPVVLPDPEDPLTDPELPELSPWEQVLAAREPERPSAGQLVDRIVTGGVPLRARGNDATVRAVVGRIGGSPAVAVALGAERGLRPTPDGYRLLSRAARLADRLDLPLVSVVDTPGAEPGPEAEAAGLAGEIAEAFHAVLACRAPTLGVLIGEGGSGGALAGLVCDLVWVSPSSYLAALVPEGAAETLRTTPEDAAVLLRLTPGDVLRLGVADGLAPEPDDPGFAARVAEALGTLRQGADAPRRLARHDRWAGPAPGTDRC